MEKLQCNLLYAFDSTNLADVVLSFLFFCFFFCLLHVVASTAEMLNICYCSLMFPLYERQQTGIFRDYAMFVIEELYTSCLKVVYILQLNIVRKS